MTLKRLKEETGQALVEYAIILAFIALFIIPSMLFMSYAMENLFMKTGSMVDAPPEGSQSTELLPPYTTPVP